MGGRSLAATAWHFRWAILANLYLLAPVLWYESRVDQGGPDKTLLFTLPASLLGLLTVQLWFRRVWLTHLLLFPFYVSVLFDLFVIGHYGTRLGSSMVLVIIENLSDAREFVHANLRAVGSASLLMLGGYGFVLWKMRTLRVNPSRRLKLGALAGLALLYGAVKMQAGGLTDLAAHDRSSPFGVVSQSYLAYLVFDEAGRQAKLAERFRFGAERAQTPNEPEAYVLVIGESARPDRWSLYGRARRNTTPRLAARKELVPFSDVVSQASVTKVSVPLLLTRGGANEMERTTHERSVVSAFREAGFTAHWVSTQQRGPLTGAINRYSSEADQQIFFERRYDEVLAKHAAKLLARREPKRVFLVIHMNGSHFEYTSRYPGHFDVFGDARGGRRERLRNAYDNTVRYTDFVLDEIIAALEKRPGLSALFFVADHGENLEDDARALVGHYHHNEYDLPVPMFAWHSERYRQRYPERVAAARANAAAPLSTRSVFHSLLQLAGISVKDPETPGLSVYSRQLRPAPRIVLRESHPVDFDKWRKATLLRLSSQETPASEKVID